jgi:hypothetical protein
MSEETDTQKSARVEIAELGAPPSYELTDKQLAERNTIRLARGVYAILVMIMVVAATLIVIGPMAGWWSFGMDRVSHAHHSAASPSKLRYCDKNLHCWFGGGVYLFSQVSRDCYGSDAMTQALWDANKDKSQFKGLGPNGSWTGLEFELPRACDKLDPSKAG